MRVLAVDTTSARGSVAVVAEQGPLAEARVESNGGHSRWLLPACQALLRGLGIEAGELDAFAVTVGPGSFTGLRVGLSSVQGLAFASGRPCVGLCTLDVLALAARGQGDPIVAVMDAFRGEVYSAVYDREGRRRAGPGVGALGALLAGLPAGAAFVGDAVAAERDTIARLVPSAVFPAVDLYLAGALGRTALACLAAGETIPASQLRPLYLRPAEIRPPHV